MNREIKFRGKTLHSRTIDGKTIPAGTWIYGYYYKFHNAHNIIMEAYYQSQIALDIDPNTVGQSTNRYDKNKHIIFEGDVIQFTDENGRKYTRKVEYWDCAFRTYDFALGAAIPMHNMELFKWQVIGNIYDNPEMDKEGRK